MTHKQKFWFSSSIAGASSLLAIITIFGKGFGLIREIVYASNFGLSLEFDLFLVGSVVLISINTAVYYLAQHYFIPEYHLKKKISIEEGKLFFNSSFTLFIMAGFFLSLILFLFSSQIVQVFISEQNQRSFELTRTIFVIFLFSIPFNSGISITSAYLQSNFNFHFPALVQLIMNIIIVALVFFLSDIYKILILPFSFLFSYIIGFLILIHKTRKEIKFSFNYFFKLKVSSKQVKNLISLLVIEVLSLSYTLLDRYYFENLDQGGISALNYAMTLYVLPISIVSISIITVLFPKFAESANSSLENLSSNLKNGININIYLMIPISIIFVFMGGDFIKIFYERGKFTSSDTVITHVALLYYSISLVFYATYLVLVKLLYSVSKYSIILYLSTIAFFLKMFLNHILVDSLKQNGLALSTSLVYIFLLFSSSYFSFNLFKMDRASYYFKQFIFTLSKSILALIFIYIVSELIVLPDLLKFLTNFLLFILFYLLSSILIESDDYMIIKNTMASLRNHN